MHPLTVMLLEQILIIFLAALSQSDIANLGDSNGIIPTFLCTLLCTTPFCKLETMNRWKSVTSKVSKTAHNCVNCLGQV